MRCMDTFAIPSSLLNHLFVSNGTVRSTLGCRRSCWNTNGGESHATVDTDDIATLSCVLPLQCAIGSRHEVDYAACNGGERLRLCDALQRQNAPRNAPVHSAQLWYRWMRRAGCCIQARQNRLARWSLMLHVMDDAIQRFPQLDGERQLGRVQRLAGARLRAACCSAATSW